MSDSVYCLVVNKRDDYGFTKFYKVFGCEANNVIKQDDYVYALYGNVQKFHIVRKTIKRSEFENVFSDVPTDAQELAEFAFNSL